MRKQEIKQRIEKLRKVINHHRYLYHVQDLQEISEAALDSLKKELFDLEQKYPQFITFDSPTQRVGGSPLDKFKKVKHTEPMLSLNDAFSKEDMQDWFQRLSKLLPEKERKEMDFFCELKIDGLAIELIYEKGLLKTGSTRGDGNIGEDITQNLKTVEAIPLSIKEYRIQNSEFRIPQTLVVRGEVFISKKEFEKVNKEQKKANLSVYANPRNLAAGSVRQLDPKITAKRRLDSFVYDLLTDFGAKTHQDRHKILKILGFKTNPHNKYCKDIDKIADFYKKAQTLREKLPYEIDGIVVIVNSNKIFKKLGAVGKTSRGAIAFKFMAKESTTIVEDIKVQIGRTGALTPVAYLKPVKVGGVIISRATLHNEDEIKRLGLKIGDTVVVGRAGDVIPDIVKVLPDFRTGKEKEFKMPFSCPICASKIKKKAGEVAYYCSNPDCFAVQREYFCHFVSKNAFDIAGLGPKIADRLIEEGLSQEPADIFFLKEGDLLLLERFAEKSAANLISAIQSRKKIFLPKFIYALGIRNVGEETAIDLAEEFGSLENLKKAGLDRLEKVKDIGPVVAKSIYEWFGKGKNVKFLEKLKKAGIRIKNQKPKTKNPKLKDLIFVLTGELDLITRQKAKEKIRELGGEVSESVSKKTSYVVVGKEPGSKLEKAKKLGVKIISEKEFLKIIK